MSGFTLLKTPFEVDACILCGQSNMAGGDTAAGSPDSTYTSVQPNTWIFYKPNDYSSSLNGSIQQLLYNFNNSWRTTDLPSNGPEVSIGYTYYMATGRPLLIIKYAYGGSALVDPGVSYVNGIWQWDADPSHTSGLPHYNIMMNNFVIPALYKAKANGIIVNLKAFVWCQGETDAGNAIMAAGYESALTSLFNKFNTDISPYGIKSPNFNFIISRTHNNFSPARPYQNNIRTAQQNVATAFGCPIINTDGYGLNADFIHFTRAAQASNHGIDIANSILSL